ncbi:MAG TPA: acyl-CoA dehydratase activase, partial [bacterium]|nr:acyl-CoA dehydratase activase [bacterium]
QCGLADRVITEISAAGAGAFRMNGRRPGLVVDIGGQDTKVIEINGEGSVSDFLMNDKCAAGTGRFLELMAQVLETDMEGFSQLARSAEAPRRLNATCSVFAESEVVSLIAHGESKTNIAAGLFEAVASRVAAMLRQFQEQPVFFCGGGARSPALRLALERLAGRPVQVLDPPQFVVAFGAAMLPDGV